MNLSHLFSSLFLLTLFSLPLYAQSLDEQSKSIQLEIDKLEMKGENMTDDEFDRILLLQKKLLKLQREKTAKKDAEIAKAREENAKLDAEIAKAREKTAKLKIIIRQMLSK